MKESCEALWGDKRLWGPTAFMDPLSLFLVPWHCPNWVAQTGINTSAFPLISQVSWFQILSILLPVYTTRIFPFHPPELLSLLSPTPPAFPPRFPTALTDLQSIPHIATKAATRKHRSDDYIPWTENHGQLQCTLETIIEEEEGMRKTSVNQTWRPRYPSLLLGMGKKEESWRK